MSHLRVIADGVPLVGHDCEQLDCTISADGTITLAAKSLQLQTEAITNGSIAGSTGDSMPGLCGHLPKGDA